MGMFNWKGQKLWPALSACLLGRIPLFSKSGKGSGWLKRQDGLVSPGRWMGTRLLLWVSLQVAEVSRCKRWKGVWSVSEHWFVVREISSLPVLALSNDPFTHHQQPQGLSVRASKSVKASDCSQPCYALHSCLLAQTVRWAGMVSLRRPLILRRDTKHPLAAWSRENLHKQFPKSLAFHSLLSIIRFLAFFSFSFFLT